jgi:cytochrome P450
MSTAPNRDAHRMNPIAAVTHRDPYPYYADLLANKPLYRDDALGLWVASSAAAVTAALTSDACRVRPLQQPVPPAIDGSAAREMFRRLVRMNNGVGHCPLNRAVTATLASVTSSAIAKETRHRARELADELAPTRDFDGLSEFCFRLSVRVIGSMLDVQYLVQAGLDFDRVTEHVAFRPSANALIPVFLQRQEAQL